MGDRINPAGRNSAPISGALRLSDTHQFDFPQQKYPNCHFIQPYAGYSTGFFQYLKPHITR
jgi:hypothetical protein